MRRIFQPFNLAQFALMLNTLPIEILSISGLLGGLLDTVFIDKKQRKRISKYLEKKNTDLSPNQKFSTFLQQAYAVIFGRFFSSKLFSFRFIASAAIISLTSFSIVILVQALLFTEQFTSLKIDLIQIGLFAAFIFFNICFDYFTIIQTKIFIEASLSAKSIFRSLVFIGSDLFVTMNTFILSYAVFLLMVVQWFVWSPVYASFVIPDGWYSREINPETKSRFFSRYENEPFVQRIRYQDSVSFVLLQSDSEKHAEYTILQFYSSFDLADHNTRALLIAKLTSLNYQILNLSAIEDEQEIEKFREIFKLAADPLRQVLNRNGQNFVILDFSVNGSIWRDGTINGPYSASFALTDALEDGFPESLTKSFELLSLSRLIRTIMASPILDSLTAVCFEDSRPTLRLLMGANTVNILDKCEEFVMVEHRWVRSLDQNLSLIGRETEGYGVPFNTLLITSILPTAFFYFSIILLFIAVCLYSFLVNRMNRVKKFFLRAPFAISGFLFGVVIWVISSI